jgi:hypothetical protein
VSTKNNSHLVTRKKRSSANQTDINIYIKNVSSLDMSAVADSEREKNIKLGLPFLACCDKTKFASARIMAARLNR